MDDLPIVAAGRVVPDALDRIRRYCGLAWSGGPPETWAWHYYDAVPTAQDDAVTAVDVLCAAALHPGLSRNDLSWFRGHRDDMASWLHEVPVGIRLCDVADDVVHHVASLPDTFSGASISLLSKVLHRKRPQLIPLLDRHVIDWYRPVTARRSAVEAWGPIVHQMRAEALDPERQLMMAIGLTGIKAERWPSFDEDDRPRLSPIRAVDIAIWMGSR